MSESPQIIGSKVLMDGIYKKGIGSLIRDMSLVLAPKILLRPVKVAAGRDGTMQE